VFDNSALRTNTTRVIKKENVAMHAPEKKNSANNRNKKTTITMGEIQEGNYSDKGKLISCESSMIFTIISSGICLSGDMFTLIITQRWIGFSIRNSIESERISSRRKTLKRKIIIKKQQKSLINQLNRQVKHLEQQQLMELTKKHLKLRIKANSLNLLARIFNVSIIITIMITF